MSSLTRERIELLAQKKLQGTITPEEEREWEDWLRREPEGPVFWATGDEDEAALKERLLARIRQDAGLAGKSRSVRLPGYPYRWVAAASLILLIAAGYLLIPRKHAGQQAVNDPATHDVAPGHNGAILTLANGKTIVLDSAGNGTIALQGGSRVLSQNGELAYTKAEAVTSGEVLYNTMSTPRGRQFRLILPDGTVVWLNAASSITYPTTFNEAERRVSLHGEAYFEVKANARQPFVVMVDSSRVEVLGTHFDCMAYADEPHIRTTLLEGSVRCVHGHEKELLLPGEQCAWDTVTGHLHTSKTDTAQAVAWVHGQLAMKGLDIATLMRQISRWYDVDVTLEGDIRGHSFGGMIDRNVNLSSILEALEANGIHARVEGRKVILSISSN